MKPKQCKYCKSLCKVVREYILKMDELMKQPSTNEFGQAIAKQINILELENDRVRHFGLGEKL